MKRSLLLCISFIVFLTAPLLHAAEAEEPSDHGSTLQEILILNSYHPGYAWSDDEQAGIIDVFQSKDKSGIPVIEYLDIKRLPDGRHLAELKKLFRLKYQYKKFSAVIAMDNPALEFAIDNQLGLFRNAPIVFCGINNYTPSLLKGRSDVTGIVEAIDLAGTIEVMLRLHPATQEIFSPHDYTATGLAVRKELEALVPRFDKVRFRFTDPLTMGELLKQMERLPKNSLLLEIGFITDKSGRTFGISETTKLFSERSPVPIYSTYEQRLGFGIVGGKLLSARIHGANAARLALRILAGEKASAIPVVFESDSQFMFDYKVMNRFGIPLSALPEGSTVINKPVSFYAANRLVIQTALGIIVFMAVVIFLLTINIVQRRRSLVVIRRSEELFKIITTNNPDHILIQDKDLRYSFVMNPQLSLKEQDMIGKTDHDFLSKEDADKLTKIKRQVLKTGSPVQVEVPLASSQEEQQFFSGSYIPKFDAKGQIDGLIGYFRNVTERKLAEEALRASEEWHRAILQTAMDGIWRVDTQGHLLEVNETYCRMSGYSVQELLAMSISDLEAAEAADDTVARIQKIMAQGEDRFESRHRRKDGTIFDVEIGVQYRPTEGGQFVVFLQDITERKRAEKALCLSNEIMTNMSEGVVLISISDGSIVYANPKFLNMFGYGCEELVGKNISVVNFASDKTSEEVKREISTALSDEGVWRGEIYNRKKDGTAFWCFANVSTLKDSIHGEIWVAVHTDITERKRVEEDVHASREQMRALAGRLQAVREEERTLIAREIHDELGGALTGLKIDVSLLTRVALKIENETVRTFLLAGMDSMIKFTDATIQTVRRIAMELRPGILDDLGLVAALEWQLKDFEKRTGIGCEFIPPVEDIKLDADLSTALFRIFQETLTNVVRHSGATEVRVRLREDADSSTLEVEDNGKGIEKEKTLSSKSLGLLGMRERAQMFGGRITVTGNPGIGTIVTVEIPLQEKSRMDLYEGDAG